jgi:hypothetical protein
VEALDERALLSHGGLPAVAGHGPVAKARHGHHRHHQVLLAEAQAVAGDAPYQGYNLPILLPPLTPEPPPPSDAGPGVLGTPAPDATEAPLPTADPTPTLSPDDAATQPLLDLLNQLAPAPAPAPVPVDTPTYVPTPTVSPWPTYTPAPAYSPASPLTYQSGGLGDSQAYQDQALAAQEYQATQGQDIMAGWDQAWG